MQLSTLSESNPCSIEHHLLHECSRNSCVVEIHMLYCLSTTVLYDYLFHIANALIFT